MPKSKQDSSLLIYNKHDECPKSAVHITLKNGTEVSGFIVGYFHGDAEGGDPFVYKWHIAKRKDYLMPEDLGKILHKDIRQVRFVQDDSIIDCDSL